MMFPSVYIFNRQISRLLLIWSLLKKGGPHDAIIRHPHQSQNNRCDKGITRINHNLGPIMPYERVADRIIIQQSRISAIIWFFLLFGITIGWQWVVFGMPKNLTELMALDKGFVGTFGLNRGFYLVAGLPVFLIPSILKNFRIAAAGRTIIINGAAKTISKMEKSYYDFQKSRILILKTWKIPPLY